ncbi:unnamed protein product [Sphagnum troendelagicum]|uniref:Uncharacterized protein n=1 Tax=Sphagnum troendelagicum TaxID=128251 RepID=A0ABP0UL42_9BRYO
MCTFSLLSSVVTSCSTTPAQALRNSSSSLPILPTLVVPKQRKDLRASSSCGGGSSASGCFRVFKLQQQHEEQQQQRQWKLAATTDGKKGSSSANREMDAEKIPEWAKPGSEELPPWARNEVAKPKEQAEDLPFFVYLIASSLVAIAAVGSVFEYFNKNAIFGVVPPDSPFWAPILGIFVFTGFPSAGFLWFKAISLANKASEDQDREDGYER